MQECTREDGDITIRIGLGNEPGQSGGKGDGGDGCLYFLCALALSALLIVLGTFLGCDMDPRPFP